MSSLFRTFRIAASGLALLATAAGLPGAASAQEAVQLRTDWLPHGVHSIFFTALEKGLYKQRGLDVTIVDGSGSGATVQTVGTKVDTFGYVSASSVLTAVPKGVPVVSVAALARSDAFTLIVKEDGPIHAPRDLAGKTIATTAGAFDGMLMPAFLTKVGLDPQSVTMLNVDAAGKLGVFISGNADAVVQSAWFNLPVLKAAGHKVRGFQWKDNGIDLPGYVLVAHSSTVEEKPEMTRAFVEATLEALAYAHDNPDEAIENLAKHRPDANINKDVAKEQLLAFRDYYDSARTVGKPAGWQSLEDWSDAQELLVENGVITTPVDPARFFTNAFAGE